jgi:hypothetical protein
MEPSSLSKQIKSNSTTEDVHAITERLSTRLKVTAESADKPTKAENNDTQVDEDDWETLADKELEAPVEPVKPSVTQPTSATVLELYDFDPRIQMHQLVKDFTKIVDPAGTMSFRPKMANQSLLLAFNNPKHGMFYMNLN